MTDAEHDTLAVDLRSADAFTPCQAAAAVDTTTVTAGNTVPSPPRPDLRGNGSNRPSRGVPSLVLFWNPGRTHCQALIPANLAAERHPRRPGIAIVSRGPACPTDAVGFASPVMFDADRSNARTFGMATTSSTILIDCPHEDMQCLNIDSGVVVGTIPTSDHDRFCRRTTWFDGHVPRAAPATTMATRR